MPNIPNNTFLTEAEFLKGFLFWLALFSNYFLEFFFRIYWWKLFAYTSESKVSNQGSKFESKFMWKVWESDDINRVWATPSKPCFVFGPVTVPGPVKSPVTCHKILGPGEEKDQDLDQGFWTLIKHLVVQMFQVITNTSI